jgi:hypothetical protein
VTHPKIPLAEDLSAGGGAPAQFTAPPAARPAAGGGLLAATRRSGAQAAAPGAPTGPAAPRIEYKLFRFFDYSVQPGKSYRYRVRLVLENPNYGVPVQYLANPQLSKGSTRQAPWSEASTAVAVPRGSNLLAGAIKKATGLTEQKYEVMVRMWDPKEAVDAARNAELVRGQVVNFAPEEVPIDDPLGNGSATTRTINFTTDILVVDMTGGDTLVPAKARSPGQLLVLEPSGQLAVKSELADADAYEPAKQHLKDLQDRSKPASTTDDDDKPSSKKKKDKDTAAAAPSTGGLLGAVGKKQADSKEGKKGRP